MKRAVGIIPARMGSSRFPGKPLTPILGLPMILHVFHRSKMCPLLDQVYVATCDEEIAEVVHNAGGTAIMTSQHHERASDRTAEAAARIEADIGSRIDVVCMIQGDEPMVTPAMISEGLTPVREGTATVTNLMLPIVEIDDFQDSNEIKVVTDRQGRALYFSRAPIPSPARTKPECFGYKQVCVITFGRDMLFRFIEMPATELEATESVDMLRFLENGIEVKMIRSSDPVWSVDTQEDLQRVECKMRDDALIRKYYNGYS